MATIRYVGKRVKVGHGTKSGISVIRKRDDGGSERLPPRFDLRNHSPGGFRWGHAGSGAAQLALALLSDTVGDTLALASYQKFEFDVIARLPMLGWVLTREEILDWLEHGAGVQGANQVGGPTPMDEH